MSECNCGSLANLSGMEGKKYADTHLKLIKVDDVNWTILHQCICSGKYWEEYFPNSEEHGGGTSKFRPITNTDASKKYNV